MKFIYRYFVKPIARFFQIVLIRIHNSESYIATNVVYVNSWKNITVGAHSRIMRNTVLAVASRDRRSAIKIGNNTYIGENNNLRAADGVIEIGNNCMISQGVTIVTSNHLTKIQHPMAQQPWGSKNGRVVIEDDVWIGANSVILPDVIIHTGAVVAAGSIVTKDVTEYTIVAGNPAKILKYRE